MAAASPGGGSGLRGRRRPAAAGGGGGAPAAPAGLLEAGVPVLGICYGFQLMVSALGGTVARTPAGEYGATAVEQLPGGTLLRGLPGRFQAWMSHGDTCTAAPPGFMVTG